MTLSNIQQQIPPDKRGPLFEVWLRQQPIAKKTEVDAWVERVTAEGAKGSARTGKKGTT